MDRVALVVQPSLFGGGRPGVDRDAEPHRVELAGGAWIEHVPGWLTGEQRVFDQVVESTTWHEHRRPMYDRLVDVPRLTASLPADGPIPAPLVEAQTALRDRHGTALDRIGLALYRDGRDSVAPHGDTVAREREVSLMATISCGARRRLVLTPVAEALGSRPGSVGLELGHGDLLVMGGTIQRTWRHAIPKTARPVGPRLCVMFRPCWME